MNERLQALAHTINETCAAMALDAEESVDSGANYAFMFEEEPVDQELMQRWADARGIDIDDLTADEIDEAATSCYNMEPNVATARCPDDESRFVVSVYHIQEHEFSMAHLHIAFDDWIAMIRADLIDGYARESDEGRYVYMATDATWQAVIEEPNFRAAINEIRENRF